MRESVVIKGNKAGMLVILNPETEFQVLLEAVARKFKESARFWGAAQMTLTLEGRELTTEEELQIVSVITENAQIEILCLIDTDEKHIQTCEKALNDRLLELSSRTGQFYKGTLKRGDILESEASIVIIGDVCHGAKVLSKGSVIILGDLKGTICAGVTGNTGAVVVALSMAPMQIKIADCSTNFREKGKRLGRGPMLACIEKGGVSMKQLKKNAFELLNFN